MGAGRMAGCESWDAGVWSITEACVLPGLHPPARVRCFLGSRRSMTRPAPSALDAHRDARQVGTAVQSLAASAKVLNTLTAARALYMCRGGAGARLSNELFHQASGASGEGAVAGRLG